MMKPKATTVLRPFLRRIGVCLLCGEPVLDSTAHLTLPDGRKVHLDCAFAAHEALARRRGDAEER